MNIQTLTVRLVDGHPIDDLTAEIQGAADEILTGAASPVQMASFLTALHMHGETPGVVAQFAQVMRARAIPFRAPDGVILDTCGTGGDHSGTFNISTTAAFVAAGAGVRVAKHGNRSMTSKCGSSDVLAHLGIAIEAEGAEMEHALAEVGICFLHAQRYHGSMKHVAPVRRELGFRTMFNLLGPLANPARANHQLIGVFEKKAAHLMAQVLNILGAESALVVHGSDGLDEITVTGETYAYRVKEGRVEEMLLNPHVLGFDMASPEDLKGGDAAENAQILLDILSGKETGPRLDIVLLNAGAAIHVAGEAESLIQGIEKAREVIASGAALAKLQGLQKLSQHYHPELSPGKGN